MGKSRTKNKRKNIIILSLAVFLILLIISLLTFLKKGHHFPENLGVVINNNDYYLEVAQNNQERKKGLSDRQEICSNCGMLFIFDKEDKHSFWMKDTHLPLDIIWLNSKKEIVKIITAAQTDSETIYTNKIPAKYAIELPANESLKLKLQIGNTIPIFGDE
jgi:uncharacterized protein